MRNRTLDRINLLSLLCIFLIPFSSQAQQADIEDFLGEEGYKEALKRIRYLDCDPTKIPWNSFKIDVYENGGEKPDTTFQTSPIIRKTFDPPRLKSDDEKLLADLKVRITKIEKNSERLPSGKLFPDDQKVVDQIKGWITKLEDKKGTILNTPESSLQGQGILHLLAAHNVRWNGKARVGDELQGLREKVPMDLAEVIESFPCESNNIRVCAVASPQTENAMFNDSSVDESKLPEAELRKKYQRIRLIKIDHCLSDYPMSETEKNKIDTACNKWPHLDGNIEVNSNDTAYRFIRLKFVACRDALNNFLKTQANLPLKNGKYIPSPHKK